MNQRAPKRQKRQVSHARGRVGLSEPDPRAPQELAARREANHALTAIARRLLQIAPALIEAGTVKVNVAS